jgi:large subunit ribosomal protein L9
MKVILLKDVRGVGHHGEIKEVKEGYARNFLIPNKVAEVATEEKMKLFEAQAAARAEQTKKEEEQLMRKVDSLRGKEVKLSARATEKGGLFKSISSLDVAKAIREQHSLEIPESSVEVPVIKTLGEHDATLSCKDTTAPLKVVVSEA